MVKKTSVDLPEDLWRQAKIWAAFRNKTMGELITDALRAHVADLRRRGDIAEEQTGEQMVKRLTNSIRPSRKRGGKA